MSSMTLDPLSPSLENEFQYRPVPPLVPVSAAFVLLSLTAFTWDLLLVVPATGLILSFIAFRQVAKSGGAYGGLGLSATCLTVQPLLIVGAIGFHAYAYATEVPEGFNRVSFASDISDKGFITDRGTTTIHPDVQKLEAQPIFLKGYMYPTGDTQGLKSFVLCKDSGECCFGGQPKITDMIFVEMDDDRTVNFRTGLVSVAGTFHATPTLDPTGLNPVYKLDCKYFSGSKTTY